MARDSFPAGVADQLKWYVYRLIDPRNGETFYVGKGRRDRVFAHAKGDFRDTTVSQVKEIEETEDASDLKIKRINEIRSTGLEVGHVIHRHGIEHETVAYEIEAALIDAYPGLTNQIGGHGSGDFGSRHVEEIVQRYGTEPFEVRHSLILIYIGASYRNYRDNPYDAVRFAWKESHDRVSRYELVLGHANGLVVGAYRPKRWLRATQANFPGFGESDLSNRWGFIGEQAEEEIWSYYLGKRIPEEYKGAQNPIRYCDP